MRIPLAPASRIPRHGALALLALLLAGCSPIYVIKAGIAQGKILAARQPIPEVVLDPATDEDTRDKLLIAMEAREFARDSLRLDVGDSYTSFTRLESDTLALVLSAAYRDRLQPKTWWFPIVGHVPYRGFFDEDDAREEQRELREEGLDTYLRPTAAFSTLGWFADPLLSTLLDRDRVELAETVLHELSHNHLFVSGHVRFNESYATFVGRVGAVEFFCGREGSGPSSVTCARAEARWRDARRFSRFLDGLVAELEGLYGDATLDSERKVAAREEIFDRYLRRFEEAVQPSFESLTFGYFLRTPLNNATLLARMRYYHRLDDFHALYERHGGDLAAAVGDLAAGVERVDDPFELLPRAGGTGDPGGSDDPDGRGETATEAPSQGGPTGGSP